jgi:hypothetical protein
MYRDIWATKDEITPRVGDYVLGEYAEQGIITAITPTMIYIAVFHATDLRACLPFEFDRRWDVRR